MSGLPRATGMATLKNVLEAYTPELGAVNAIPYWYRMIRLSLASTEVTRLQMPHVGSGASIALAITFRSTWVPVPSSRAMPTASPPGGGKVSVTTLSATRTLSPETLMAIGIVSPGSVDPPVDTTSQFWIVLDEPKARSPTYEFPSARTRSTRCPVPPLSSTPCRKPVTTPLRTVTPSTPADWTPMDWLPGPVCPARVNPLRSNATTSASMLIAAPSPAYVRSAARQ